MGYKRANIKMKKLIALMISFFLISSYIYADQQTCRVAGSSNNNIATIQNPRPVASCGFNACSVEITILLQKPASEETSVIAYVYDSRNNLVRTAVVIFDKGEKEKTVYSEVSKDGTYRVTLSDATCKL